MVVVRNRPPAKLVPFGGQLLVREDVRRLSPRDSFSTESPVAVGQRYELEVDRSRNFAMERSMTRPRRHLPGSTYSITRRASQRRFWLAPKGALKNLFDLGP